MSFDDYGNHMTDIVEILRGLTNHIYQKHRLCIALVIIKTKPPDITTEEYLKKLKSKMADVMDVDDVTLCSEDFMADYDESFNVLRDFQDIGGERQAELDTRDARPEYDESFNVLRDFQDIGGERQAELDTRDARQEYDDEQATPSLPENFTQTTYCNSQPQYNFNNIAAMDNTTRYEIEENTSQQHYTKNEIPKSTDRTNTDLNRNHLKLGSIVSSKVNVFAKEDLKSKVNNVIDSSNKGLNLVNDSTYDSQKTILYTLHGFTQNDSHFSQSQTQIFVPNKYLYALKKDKKILKNITDEVTNMGNGNKSIGMENNSIENKRLNLEINNENKNINKTVENVSNDKFSGINNKYSENNEIDTSMSIFNTQNTTICMQNDENDINNMILENSQSINDYFNEINCYNAVYNLNNDNNEPIQNSKVNSEMSKREFSQDYEFNETMNAANHFDAEFTNLDFSFKDENKFKNATTNQKIISSQNSERKIDFTEQNSKIVEMEIDDTNTSEFIPYKVLEELNKIKIYLRRKGRRRSTEGYSTDSGYKSDSQPRSFHRGALQLSGQSINQSAYCLLNHILKCPLVAVTRDITSEIAQTLADLIDRLHDEETYPPFLEELLDTVDILVRQVLKARNSTDSEFLNKDEFLQRALLLNKSIHIQRHCIDKITNILGKFHEKVTDINVTYELTNIDELENISYIFHILEILIKKYMKKKIVFSQANSQISQEEDKVLKRSSITDIWRKKWNTNVRETPEGSREKRCVLKNCSEILNKIIVDCMNSYSLVAFSALKCFNTIQS